MIKYKQRIKRSQDSIELPLNNEERIYNLLHIDTIKYLSLNTKFCDIFTNVKDSSNKIYLLKDIIKCNSLIFRFSEYDCHSCIEKALVDLKQHINEIKFNTIIIGSVKYNIKIKNYIINNFANKNIFYIPDSAINIPAELLNTPYFIFTDSSLNVKNIYVPNDDFPVLKLNFYNSITK
jgi:hypothetical protein